LESLQDHILGSSNLDISIGYLHGEGAPIARIRSIGKGSKKTMARPIPT
jgi:hypothetical protein